VSASTQRTSRRPSPPHRSGRSTWQTRSIPFRAASSDEFSLRPAVTCTIEPRRSVGGNRLNSTNAPHADWENSWKTPTLESRRHRRDEAGSLEKVETIRLFPVASGGSAGLRIARRRQRCHRRATIQGVYGRAGSTVRTGKSSSFRRRQHRSRWPGADSVLLGCHPVADETLVRCCNPCTRQSLRHTYSRLVHSPHPREDVAAIWNDASAKSLGWPRVGKSGASRCPPASVATPYLHLKWVSKMRHDDNRISQHVNTHVERFVTHVEKFPPLGNACRSKSAWSKTDCAHSFGIAQTRFGKTYLNGVTDKIPIGNTFDNDWPVGSPRKGLRLVKKSPKAGTGRRPAPPASWLRPRQARAAVIRGNVEA
jgi:hypothetical protein